MDNFDLEKIEALDFDSLSSQLQYIFKTEEDIANFVQFLKNVQRFTTLSNDKRHTTLMDLGFVKSQIQKYERQIVGLINKKKMAVTKAGIKKAKMIGEKITENIVTFYSEEDISIEGLEKIHNVVKCWSDYMVDLTYLCGQTNKILGGYV
jgi:hypothetical protein